MESYPDDLLAGVFPLVFAVDGILPATDSPPPPLKNEDDEENSGNAEENEKREETTQAEKTTSSSTRSLFDRFLDAIAASLNEEEQDNLKKMNRSGSDTIASLLRGDDKDDSSDDEEDNRSQDSRRSAFRRNSPMSSFRNKKSQSGGGTVSPTAYARVLSSESFFQRARILPISRTHGFPPSKDPEGTKNRVLLLSQNKVTIAHCATGANFHRIKSLLDNQQAQGILPAGWLEKHVHALPSVLLVVTTLSANSSNQEAQNQYLLETIDNLRYNLAPKRNCHLHIVCLVEDDPSPSILATDAWLTLVKHHTELPSTSISLLSIKDLEADMAIVSPSLQDLHAVIREASLSYYLKLARRAKHKHSLLGHEHQPTLLPQAARYCFKIGVFYEFQLKHEKSLRFFSLAYRHVQAYYQFLLSGSPPVEVNPQDMEMKAATAPDGDEVGIEVALADASDDEEEEEEDSPDIPQAELKRALAGSKTPSDMAHQCRAVADWLNFKLLQAGFNATALGATEEGLVAAFWQWRKHAQVMLRDHDDPSNPAWNFWAYVAHQRLVMSQLVERHPPSDEAVTEEVLICCSPWRNYLAAAEAELMLDAEIRKVKNISTSSTKSGSQSMRKRFVGDLDSDGLSPKLVELSKQNHAEKALQLTLRAIQLFEQECEDKKTEAESEDEGTETPFLSSGARMYYLAGGILLGMKRYEDAIAHLEKAASSCSKWEGLHTSIRRMLVECFSHNMPPAPPDVPSEVADARMLDILFQAGLPLSNLTAIIDSYCSERGIDSLKWNVESTSDSDTSTPFSFSVTFPDSTHATAGDVVAADVTIKSNLAYPSLIKSVALKSVTGEIVVPLSDLMGAQSTKKGIDGVMLAQMESVQFSTDISLPRDLDKIPSDVGSSANAVPSARPRTAGITSAAGARLVPEDSFGTEDHNGQWSKTFLGGKPLHYDGILLRFVPAPFDATSDDGTKSPFVDVLITKKKSKSVAPPKRTPFEESNYIDSAWARPDFVPLAEGPRCLRVLGPMPHMIVTNLTEASVNGKALEGTVNRILFKVEAGTGECCFDIDYKVTCSTTLLSSDGSTTHLNPEAGVPPSTEGDVDLEVVGKRTPVIVSPDEAGTGVRSTDFGYDVPPGWRLEGTGHASDKVSHHVTSLKAGECTYICFELYRPARTLKPLENPYDSDGEGGVSDDNEDAEVCQTDFDITITYKQSRPSVQKRDGLNQADEAHGARELADSVVLEHSGSVVWESPLAADFSVDGRSQRAFPSGSRHPSNYLSAAESEQPMGALSGKQTELALINGEKTSARCVLRSHVAGDGLGIEIARIGFEEKDIALDRGEIECELQLQTAQQSPTPGILFISDENDSTRILTTGSKFGLAYAVIPTIKDQYVKGSVSTRLGVIWVDWYPVSIALPEGMEEDVGSDMERLNAHGPLRLSEPSTLKFRGPPCYIEDAPFETVLESLPPSPRVATPFEMSYRISNKTGMQQKLSILMSDQSTDERERGHISEGVLVSGLINGSITLAPFESQTLSYTALATKAGKTTMPALAISSDRYKTWLVKDRQEGSREIFVLP